MGSTWHNKRKSLRTHINDVDRDQLEKDVREYCETHDFIKARSIGLLLCVNPNGVSRILQKLEKEGVIEFNYRTRRMIVYKKRRR